MGEAAEEAYVNADTSVWWDIENCQVPKICDVNSIARNINSALSNLNYCGNVSISAYGDTRQIPPHVQQALSSTGISINHVPAGAKDASDKKILVDMLFWAIDHKAPANCLLISGDRDFSNALHKLQMRKYNILLAHPKNVSPALVTAAKSVWLWTTLVTGGAPIAKNVSGQPVVGNSQFNRQVTRDCSSEPTHAHQSVVSQSDIPAAANQKFIPSVKVGTGDPEYKQKHIKKNLSQPNMAKAPTVKTRVQDNNHQPDNEETRLFKKAPHEFFRPNGHATSTNWSAPNNFPVNPDPSATNVNKSAGQEDQNPSHTKPRFTPMRFNSVPGKMVKANPAYHTIPAFKPQSPPLPPVSPTSSLDIANLTLSHYPNDDQRPLNLAQQTGEVSKLNSVENTNPESNSSLGTNPDIQTNVPLYHNPIHAGASSSSGVCNAGGLASTPSSYELRHLGLVLDAIDRLKKDNISPTEANIADCIRFGDLKNRNTDVREALNGAVERKLVVRHTLGGGLQMYVRLGQKIWSCINPEGGNPNQYSKATWNKIEQFLFSPGGQSAIVASSCKYVAALNLKQLCLQDLPLGHVICIMNILTGPKRWIQHNQSGWQPVTISVNKAHVEASKDAVS